MTTTTQLSAHRHSDTTSGCAHPTRCPAFDAPDRDAARVVAYHPEQGWNLLCNGVVVFDDTGEILPNRTTIAPHRPAVYPAVYPAAA
jgi:hypothetical protein